MYCQKENTKMIPDPATPPPLFDMVNKIVSIKLYSLTIDP